MVSHLLKLIYLLIVLFICDLIDYGSTSSLGDKVSNSFNGDLCSSPSVDPARGSCWCHYSDPINITCNSVSNLDLFIGAINRTVKLHYGKVKIVQVNESFKTIKQIVTWLTSYGSLRDISSSVEILQLSWNRLETISFHSFSKLTKLTELDLSNNQIGKIFWTSLTSLVTLNLSHNRLLHLDLANVLNVLPSLDKLDISFNLLETLDGLDSLVPNNLINLYAQDNPWNCNHPSSLKLGELINSARPDTRFTSLSIKSPWDLLCSEPIKMREMTLEQAYSVNQTSICSRCDCIMNKKDTLMVNCSYRDLTHLPETLPQGTRIVQLNGNRLRSFSLSSEDTSSWATVKVINLDNNEINGLQDLEITKILRNLLSINLQGNQVREVPIHILEQFTSLLKINLSVNPWTCDCNTLIFQKWLQKNHEKVDDINKLFCSQTISGWFSFFYRTKERLPIHQMPISDICPQPNVPLHYLDILSGTCAILTILIALKVLYDSLWQKKTGKLPYFFKLNC